MVSGHSVTTTKSLFMFPFSKGFKIPRPSHNGPKLLNLAYRVNTLWPPPSILHSALRPKWPFQQKRCVPCLLSGRGWGNSDCSFLLPPSLHIPKCHTRLHASPDPDFSCIYICASRLLRFMKTLISLTLYGYLFPHISPRNQLMSVGDTVSLCLCTA